MYTNIIFGSTINKYLSDDELLLFVLYLQQFFDIQNIYDFLLIC